MALISEIRSKRIDIINIASRYKISKIKLFGSVIREEEMTNSDIDFLVDCSEDCSLFDLIGLKSELEGFLGRKIDIVTEASVHWYLKDKIIREAQEI